MNTGRASFRYNLLLLAIMIAFAGGLAFITSPHSLSVPKMEAGKDTPAGIAAAKAALLSHKPPANLQPGWHRAVVYYGVYQPGKTAGLMTAKVVSSDGVDELKVADNATQGWLQASPGNYIAYASSGSDGIKDIRMLEWGVAPSLMTPGLPTRDEVLAAAKFLESQPQPKLKPNYRPAVLICYAEGEGSNHKSWVGLLMLKDGNWMTAFSNDQPGMVDAVSPGDYFGLKKVRLGKNEPGDVQMIKPAAVRPMGR